MAVTASLSGCLGRVRDAIGAHEAADPIDPGRTTAFPQYRADKGHTGVLSDRRGPAAGASIQWTVSLSDDNQPLSQPVIAEDKLAVREDGAAYVLDLATGERHWETDSGRFNEGQLAPPVFGDGTLLVPTSGGLKACAPDDGSVRWEYGGGEPAGPFAVSDGNVVLNQERGELIVLTTADKTLRVRTEPDFTDDEVIAVGLALSESGSVTYPTPFGSSLVTYPTLDADPQEVWLGNEIATTPVVRDETAYVGIEAGEDTDGSSVDLSDRSVQWRTDFTPVDHFAIPPSVTDEYLISGVGNTLVATDRPGSRTPRIQWTTTLQAGVLSAPTVADDVVYVGATSVPDDMANLWALDLNSGAKRWALRVPGGVAEPPVVTENALYLATSDGRLHALTP